ncbi:MAG TPA: hypothetical protein VHH15_18815 [Actinophytocola sp.]|nr:hypothetical protein [Actinophytocola sp.]
MEVSRGVDLAAVAGPDLYARNAFRLSGLPVDASARQVRRRTDEVEAAQRLDTDLDNDLDAVRDALHRLRDPVRRIVDELFWLWPETVGEDGVSAARHNRAVRAHRDALEAPADDPHGLVDQWLTVYETWREVIDDDLCWRYLADRVAVLGDPRLRPSVVERLRRGMPGLLLGVHARVAVGSVTGESDSATVTTHVDRMWASGFPVADVDRALVAAVEPHLARLRALDERARTVSGGPAAYREASDTVLRDSIGDRRVVFEVLGRDHPAATGVADVLASCVRECVVREVNGLAGHIGGSVRHAMRDAVRRLDEAAGIAVGRHVREDIARDTGTVLGNLVVALCESATTAGREDPSNGLIEQRRLLDESREPLRRLERMGDDRITQVRDEVVVTAFALTIAYTRATGDLVGAMPALHLMGELATDARVRGMIDDANVSLAAGPTLSFTAGPTTRGPLSFAAIEDACSDEPYEVRYPGPSPEPEPPAGMGSAVLVLCVIAALGMLALAALPPWDWSMIRYPLLGCGVIAFLAICSMVWRTMSRRY